MSRIVMPLSNEKCKKAKYEDKNYKLFDGEGLYLLVKKNNVKTWHLRYKKLDGKESIIVLGNYPTVTLKEARGQREIIKKQLLNGNCPSIARKKLKTNVKEFFFEDIAYEWIQKTAQQKQWKDNYKESVTRAINRYILPAIGNKPVTKITSRELILLIQDIINKGVIDVARKLKQQVIAIMQYALYNGVIEVNPSLDLMGLTIESRKRHQASLPLENTQDFIKKIDSYQGNIVLKLALMIGLHTFIRDSELRFARWSEIDLENKLWTIPIKREYLNNIPYSDRGVKMGYIPHLVPLSNQVIDLLSHLKKHTGDYPFVFSINGKKNISFLVSVIYRMGLKNEMTFHGIRTLACSALAESGLFTEDAIERQMSHHERNGVRASYIHKAKHIQERVVMMQWWSDYIDYVRERGYIAPYEFNI